MIIEQQVGGAAPIQDAYTGPVRQLTVDTDNWDLRLHDGSTPGGRILVSRDNGDERWQAKSAELAGLEGFANEARGYLTRLGAGSYRIRQLEVDTDQLTVENGNGYSGNPKLGLAARIETSHIFGSDITIEGVLEVTGGVNADTSGTHYGDSYGTHQGPVIGNVQGDTSGTHTGLHVGGADFRGEPIVFDVGQIPTTAISGLEGFVKLHAVPAGVILAWGGNVENIPAGWALCNGLNGTPDLRDKFIRGAGSLTVLPGNSGGSATHNHSTSITASGSHTHSVSIGGTALTEAQLPQHRHANGIGNTDNTIYVYGTTSGTSVGEVQQNGSTAGTMQGWSGYSGSGSTHTHTGSVTGGGDHTHTVDNPSASSLPPYYALCYIMRVIA